MGPSVSGVTREEFTQTTNSPISMATSYVTLVFKLAAWLGNRGIFGLPQETLKAAILTYPSLRGLGARDCIVGFHDAQKAFWKRAPPRRERGAARLRLHEGLAGRHASHSSPP